MSRPRHASSHSRKHSSSRDRSLSVTEATFQDLRLSEPTGSQHLSISSTYQPSDQRYRRPSYPRSELSASYLQTAYEPSIYSSNSSSESFLNPLPASPAPAFGIPDPDPPRFQIGPESANFHILPNPSDPARLPRADMSSFAFPPDTLGSNYREQGSYNSSRSPSMREYTFPSADASQRRSMSGPFADKIWPSSALSGPSPEESEVARQRRWNLQESRRQFHVRGGRTGTPSASAATSSKALDLGRVIDCSIASSTASSYDVSSNLGSAPYDRNGSISSAHGPYLSGLSGSPTTYNDMTYQSNYGLENVNPQAMYNSPQGHGLPSMTNSTQQGYRSRRPSAAPSVSSIPDEPIRILETRSRPQCWDHGCNGRQFSTFSNLLRHQREKSGTATKSYCPRCGAEFTRTTARNGHLAHDKCTKRPSEDQ